MPYPIVLDLQGKRCVVVGAGRVAERRVLGLLAEGAEVRVIAPQATETISRLAEEGKIEWERGHYSAPVLEGVVLAFAATDHAEVNAAVASDGAAKNVLVCRADDPASGAFITPAAIRQGEFLLAVSTGGNSPTLAAVLKERLQAEFGPEWSTLTRLFGALRHEIQAITAEADRRKAVLGILAAKDVRAAIAAGDLETAQNLASKWISTR
ncbi:MAG TPA: bifunctional precorrin-2 dehydrogenase/sirohydrochlorin ferrochelatase [Capsulimonadaceae bacterium]|nr:bifunctional precorrin-2 dehydrogenase/sirohydrochlorin ferrochelatase [Capsulimonadaceae bacterium]